MTKDNNNQTEEARSHINKVMYQTGYHPYMATVLDSLRALEEGSALVYYDDEGVEHNIPADLIVEAWNEFCEKFEKYVPRS